VAVTTQSLPVLQGTHTPQALFDNILNTFERLFDQEQWLSFKKSSAFSLKRLLKKIQDEQKASKSIQNLRRMECYLKAIENLGKLMEEGLSMPDIICYIWGPTKLLLQVTTSKSLFLSPWIVNGNVSNLDCEGSSRSTRSLPVCI
jgi:hypothetical protein